MTAAHGVRAEVVAADLTDAAARAASLDAVAGRGLVPSVLVNAAGLSTVGPVHRNDPGAELAMIRTDVEAVAHLCSLMLPGMVERGAGAVLNVASTAAFQPMPGQAATPPARRSWSPTARRCGAEGAAPGSPSPCCARPGRHRVRRDRGLRPAEAEAALPRFMWMSADDVADAAVDGLERRAGRRDPRSGQPAGALAARLAPARCWSRSSLASTPGCGSDPAIVNRSRPPRPLPVPRRGS